MKVLLANDFPLYAIGNRVYGRMDSSPICTATDDRLAADIAFRLNRDQQALTGGPYGFVSTGTLVHG